MSIELMLLSVNINLVAFSSFLNDLVGQIFTLFVLTVAAAEAAIGLAILVSFFRNRGTIAVEDVNVMKGDFLELIILFSPLLGAIVGGFFWRSIGESQAIYLTIALLFYLVF